jgi:hypothetical protein
LLHELLGRGAPLTAECAEPIDDVVGKLTPNDRGFRPLRAVLASLVVIPIAAISVAVPIAAVAVTPVPIAAVLVAVATILVAIATIPVAITAAATFGPLLALARTFTLGGSIFDRHLGQRDVGCVADRIRRQVVFTAALTWAAAPAATAPSAPIPIVVLFLVDDVFVFVFVLGST